MQDLDEGILKAAAEGDRNAFEQIYRTFSGFVYAVALRMTRNRQDAEEISQDVFIKIYKNLGRFELRSSFKTWVYRITVNTVMDACKKASRERKKHSDYEVNEIRESQQADAERKFEKEHAGKVAEKMLSYLNPDQRICLILREIEELSYEEISKVLDLNINTVRTRIKRGREALMAYARKEKAGYAM